jgi:hypothetical protein
MNKTMPIEMRGFIITNMTACELDTISHERRCEFLRLCKKAVRNGFSAEFAECLTVAKERADAINHLKRHAAQIEVMNNG